MEIFARMLSMAMVSGLLIILRLSVVESIPENLTYTPTAPRYASTYESWMWLLQNAQYNVSIASYYWTLINLTEFGDKDQEVRHRLP